MLFAPPLTGAEFLAAAGRSLEKDREDTLQRALVKRVAVFLLASLALYVLAGSLLAPRLIERGLKALVEKQTGLTLAIEATSFNPFVLSFAATNITLIGPESTPFVSVDRLEAGVHLASLSEWVWILRDVNVEQPRLRLRSTGNLATDLGTLRTALTEVMDSTPAIARGRVTSLTVQRGELLIGRVGTGSSQFADPFFALRNLQVRLGAPGDLGDRPSARRPVQATGTINGIGVLETRGWLELARPEWTADLRLSLMEAGVLSTYLDLGPSVEWSAAGLAADATVEFAPGGTRLAGDVEIDGLELRDTASGELLVSAAGLRGSGVLVDTAVGARAVDMARLDQPRVHITSVPEKAVNLPPWLLALVFDPDNAPVTVANLEVSGGHLQLDDRRRTPPARRAWQNINGTISQQQIAQQRVSAIALRGQLSGSRTAQLSAQWQSADPLHSTRAELNLQGLDLSVWSPYIAGSIGRLLTAGIMDLDLQYRVDDRRLDLGNRLVLRNVQLGEAVATPGHAPLPLELAVALLQNGSGVITMSVPLTGRRVDSALEPIVVFGNAVANHVSTVTAAPFKVMADLVSQPGLELGTLEFPAGSAAIDKPNLDKLAALDEVLKLRPGLGLTVYPGYDPVADREALAEQQIRLHVTLAASTGVPGQTARLDFNDPKVQSVLDEFAANRLSPPQQRAISRRFAKREIAYYEAVFKTLVDNEQVAETALNRLARFRAQSVVSRLAASVGDASRIRQAASVSPQPAQGSYAVLRLEPWPAGQQVTPPIPQQVAPVKDSPH